MEIDFGLLIDLDGTLIDNEQLKAQAFAQAIQDQGVKSNPNLYKEVMGKSGSVIRDRFIRESGVNIDSDQYFSKYKVVYEDLLKSNLRIRPGAKRFLLEVQSIGFLLAIVSGSYKKSVYWIIDELNLGVPINTIVTGDDVSKKKPHPESFHLALKKLGLSQDNSFVIEDSEAGLSAASKAGIRSLAIRHSYNQYQDFSLAFNEYSSFDTEYDLMIKDLKLLFPDINI